MHGLSCWVRHRTTHPGCTRTLDNYISCKWWQKSLVILCVLRVLLFPVVFSHVFALSYLDGTGLSLFAAWKVETEHREPRLLSMHLLPSSCYCPQGNWGWRAKKGCQIQTGGTLPCPLLLPQEEWHGEANVPQLLFAVALLFWKAPKTHFQVILRGSQPLTGANRKRCLEDELLLQIVIGDSDRGYIIDTRSAQQAQQARMMGGGFESKSCYSNWKRLHRHMERCVISCYGLLSRAQ